MSADSATPQVVREHLLNEARRLYGDMVFTGVKTYTVDLFDFVDFYIQEHDELPSLKIIHEEACQALQEVMDSAWCDIRVFVGRVLQDDKQIGESLTVMAPEDRGAK